MLRNVFGIAIVFGMACTVSLASEPVMSNSVRKAGSMQPDAEKVLEILQQNYVKVKTNGNASYKLQQLRMNGSGTPVRFQPGKPSQSRMTRAGEFGAYYTIPSGVYTLKPGFKYGEDAEGNAELSRYGILAPLMEEVVFTNASTGAANFDWYINGGVTGENQEQLRAVYVPYGTEWWTPLPELTAYDENGNDSVYQHGYGYDWSKEEYVQGQAVTTGWGFVHNMNLTSETWAESLPMSSTGYWNKMMFGSDTEFKPQYFEYFQKPLSPIVLNAVYLNIATPTSTDLSTSEFAVTVLRLGSQGWERVTTRAVAKPTTGGIVDIEGYQEFGWWTALIAFEKPVLMEDEFMLLLEGPQNDTTPWAFMFDWTREPGEGNTCGFVPTTVPDGYDKTLIGQMVSYSGQDAAGNPVEFCTSLDLGLYTYMPYNIFFDAATGYPIHSVNNDTVSIGAEALDADVVLWNWEAMNIGTEAKLDITSDSEWLSAEITRGVLDTLVTYEINFKAQVCPDAEYERYGTLTFTDGQGYSSKLTFHQLSPSAIETPMVNVQTELDPNAPIYDLAGRLVKEPLAKGVYIQNKRKFVVK